MIDPLREYELLMTRRQLFGRTALGLGTATMAHLFGDLYAADGEPSAADATTSGMHHPARAKRVIYLFMSGGPSHHDLWDYKPRMREMFGKQLPDDVRDGQRITGMTARQKNGLPVAPSKYEFTRYENNDRGVWISSLLPSHRDGREGALRPSIPRSPRRSITIPRSRTFKRAARFRVAPAWAPG